MDRIEAIEILERERDSDVFVSDYRNRVHEALDLAIEALKGDLHCPKCGTIVRDGRQYHDLVYRGEAEKLQLSEETSTNFGVSEDGKTSWRAEPQEHGLFSDIDDWAKRKVKEMTEPKVSEDCISRQEAIEAVEEAIVNHDSAIMRISNLPPVTPTERTGEWAVAYLAHESVGVRPRTLYCSECNWLTSFPSAWCPNCGAKMKGGTENE